MSDPLRPDDVIPPQGDAPVQLRRLAKDTALLVPNLAKLLTRLLKDPRVPRRSKLVVAATLAYLISPIDLLPEFIPVIGQVDDILLAIFALNHLIERAGDEVVLEHWDGPQDLLGMMRGVLDTASDLVPPKIRRLMGRFSGT